MEFKIQSSDLLFFLYPVTNLNKMDNKNKHVTQIITDQTKCEDKNQQFFSETYKNSLIKVWRLVTTQTSNLCRHNNDTKRMPGNPLVKVFS